MIENSIRAYLLADPTLSGLLASGAIFPQVLPEEQALPAIAYEITDGAQPLTAGGLSGVRPWSLIFNIYANSYDTIRFIEVEIIRLLHGYTGTVQADFIGGSQVRIITRTNEQKTKIHRSILQINFYERVIS